MIVEYEKELCRLLINKYENRYKKSSNFSQKISVKFDEKGYTKYVSEQSYKYRNEIDQAVDNLLSKGFIDVRYYKASTDVEEVILVKSKILEIYKYIGKTSIDLNYENFINSVKNLSTDISHIFLLMIEQKKKTKKSIQKYIAFSEEYLSCLRVIDAIQHLNMDVFIRNFSVRMLGDSKKMEKLAPRIVEVYNECYGMQYSIDEFFLSNGVLKNPNYIYIKGNAILRVNDQLIDLSKLKTTFSICSTSINQVTFLCVEDNLVTTIENLTTFNVFSSVGLSIYLGGFSNHSKVDLLNKINADLKGLKFRHFGDIDLGGFSILRHLRQKCNFPIESYQMDTDTLIKYKDFVKKITIEYKEKLKVLLLDNSLSDCFETIKYLIQNQIVLEQESIYAVS